MFTCDMCSAGYTHRSSLKRHMHVHLGTHQQACPYCSKVYHRTDRFKYHLETCLKNEKLFTDFEKAVDENKDNYIGSWLLSLEPKY